MKKTVCSFLCSFVFWNVLALSTDSIISKFDVNVRAGYAFNSNGELMRRMFERGDITPDITHSALSFHLRYELEGLGNESTRSVYQGIGVGATTFSAPERVGTPFSFYVLQGAPIVVLSNRVSINYEWNFGVAPGWHKTSSGSDVSSNLVVGSSTNAYLNLGFKAVWRISPGWDVNGGLDLSHFSNGNTSWPNPGVNTVGASVGLTYTPGNKKSTLRSPFRQADDFNQRMVYDVMAYGAWRKTYFPYERAGFDAVGEAYLLPGHFGVAGLNFSPMWWFHPTFRTGLSADFQWSGCNALIQEDYDWRKPEVWKQLTLGLSARAELVMPIFTLNVGLGYGLVGSWETRLLYQTVNLKTYVYEGAYINVGYRMNKFRSPSNLMLGVGYTIGHTKNK